MNDIIALLGVSHSLLFFFFLTLFFTLAYFRMTSALAGILAFYPAFFLNSIIPKETTDTLFSFIQTYVVVSPFFLFYAISCIVLGIVLQNIGSAYSRSTLFEAALLAVSFAILYIIGFYPDGSLILFFEGFGIPISNTIEQILIVAPLAVLVYISYS